MDEEEKEFLDNLYRTCAVDILKFELSHQHNIIYSSLLKDAGNDVIIRKILYYLNYYDDIYKRIEYKNAEGECLIYGGSYFVENWIEILDKLIDNLKYFDYDKNKMNILNKGFNNLKKFFLKLEEPNADGLNKSYAEEMIWIRHTAKSYRIKEND